MSENKHLHKTRRSSIKEAKSSKTNLQKKDLSKEERVNFLVILAKSLRKLLEIKNDP